jgi:hypothetical protein
MRIKSTLGVRTAVVIGLLSAVLGYGARISLPQQETLPELPGPYEVPVRVVPHEAPPEDPALQEVSWHNVG